jgi:hypothetical protein
LEERRLKVEGELSVNIGRQHYVESVCWLVRKDQVHPEGREVERTIPSLPSNLLQNVSRWRFRFRPKMEDAFCLASLQPRPGRCYYWAIRLCGLTEFHALQLDARDTSEEEERKGTLTPTSELINDCRTGRSISQRDSNDGLVYLKSVSKPPRLSEPVLVKLNCKARGQKLYARSAAEGGLEAESAEADGVQVTLVGITESAKRAELLFVKVQPVVLEHKLITSHRSLRRSRPSVIGVLE